MGGARGAHSHRQSLGCECSARTKAIRQTDRDHGSQGSHSSRGGLIDLTPNVAPFVGVCSCVGATALPGAVRDNMLSASSLPSLARASAVLPWARAAHCRTTLAVRAAALTVRNPARAVHGAAGVGQLDLGGLFGDEEPAAPNTCVWRLGGRGCGVPLTNRLCGMLQRL